MHKLLLGLHWSRHFHVDLFLDLFLDLYNLLLLDLGRLLHFLLSLLFLFNFNLLLFDFSLSWFRLLNYRLLLLLLNLHLFSLLNRLVDLTGYVLLDLWSWRNWGGLS